MSKTLLEQRVQHTIQSQQAESFFDFMYECGNLFGDTSDMFFDVADAAYADRIGLNTPYATFLYHGVPLMLWQESGGWIVASFYPYHRWLCQNATEVHVAINQIVRNMMLQDVVSQHKKSTLADVLAYRFAQ